MQDIVFYVSANETLGLVRDYANMHRADAPVLTIGVAVCLRMRLFADIEVSTPYPIASFSGITNWRWSMDADFDRSTACKLVADEDGISVHTVTDTVSGETRSFTEFVIPISNMNTQELAAWLGNESTRSGLTGELVGYDNNGNAIFVLQVENFTVRNRVAGLCDPTAVDEGIVTRSVAEQMIQTAVFSLAATKQDKLTASNGGTGISVTSTGIISVSNVPQSAVTGLSASLAGKQNALAFGWGLDHDYLDDVLSLARYRTVYSPTGATVTIVPGEAYKINAAASAKMIEAASIPDNTWGLEGHLEIFVAGTGYVQTGENVFLANALKPDAVNNCTVRFHDGYAIISVEDHIAGYIVMVNATSGSGSLNYALGVSTEYISVDASLNGQTLDLAGAVTNGEKHVVGNGYTETIISGGINCTSKTTLSNLAADGVIVSSGTLTLGDVYIPYGSTVAVSGGGLAIEKVTGAGETSVIDLGGTSVFLPQNTSTYASGVVVSGGSAVSSAGAMLAFGDFEFTDCTFSGNNGGGYGGAFYTVYGVEHVFDGCTFVNNTATNQGGAVFATNKVSYTSCIVSGNTSFRAALQHQGGEMFLSSSVVAGNTYYDIGLAGGSTHTVKDSTVESILLNGGTVTFAGSNAIGGVTYSGTVGGVSLTSGAILDLTGNTNPAPIAPGGGITFEEGGATVYPSAGQASAYMLGGMTVPQIGNTNAIDLGGTNVIVSPGSTASASGCTFSGGSATLGGAFRVDGSATFVSCVFSGNSAGMGGRDLFIPNGGIVIASECSIANATISVDGSITLAGSLNIGAIDYRAGYAGGKTIISSGASINLANSINPGGTGGITVLTGGCTVNGNVIPAGTYTSINSNGQAT